jgi:hypothetical protein
MRHRSPFIRRRRYRHKQAEAAHSCFGECRRADSDHLSPVRQAFLHLVGRQAGIESVRIE